MWFSERYTLSRGRSAVPCIFLRMRSCTCPRFSFLVIRVSMIKLSAISRQRSPLSTRRTSKDPKLLRADSGSPAASFLFRSGLSDLLLQTFAGIAHALVFVRIGWTQRTHLRRHLAHLLPVDSRQRNLRLLGIHRRIHAGRQRVLDRMRVAEVKHYHRLALHFGAVADADDFQFARPAFGHALDGVIDQRARQSVKCRLRIVLANCDDD